MSCECRENNEYGKVLELAKSHATKEGKAMVVYQKACGGVDFSRREDFSAEGKRHLTLVLPRL